MTSTGQFTEAHGVERLQTSGGHYAMLALDQRESLREMFAARVGGQVGDDALRKFKHTGIEVLTPHASAVLLDRVYAMTDSRPSGLASGCGLIVAVDELTSVAGEGITDVAFDELVTVSLLKNVGADAVKVLVLWRADSGRAERARLVEKAIDLARAAGVASLVEGIVRPPRGAVWRGHTERHDAILSCAAELMVFQADIYKAEVPGYVTGDVSGVAAQSAEMSRIVHRDWVVLSNGVAADVFPSAVREACKGGASGFLAGRAIWSDTVGEADMRAALASRSIDRIKELTAIVEGEG